MMRSLFSGVAGLKTHQVKMDVIGNNIANVNTVGYKTSNVTFQDLVYQNKTSASGPNDDSGRAGINAKQIGLGVSTASIYSNVTASGSAETTGNPFDVRINGDSFFVVSDGSQEYYTRSGAFTVDANGTLCMSSNGFTVQGYAATTDDDGVVHLDTSAMSPLKIMSEENKVSSPMATSKGFITGILDSKSKALGEDSGQGVDMKVYDNEGYRYTVKYKVVPVKDANNEPIPGQFSITVADILDSNGDTIFRDYDPNVDTDANGPSKAEYNKAKEEFFSRALVAYNKSDPPVDDDFANPNGAANATASTTIAAGTAITGVTYNSVTLTYDNTNGKATGPHRKNMFLDENKGLTSSETVGFKLNLYAILGGFNTSANPSTAATPTDIRGKNALKSTKIEAFTDKSFIEVDTASVLNIDNKGSSTINGGNGGVDDTLGSGWSVGQLSSVSIGVDGKITGSYTNGQTKLLGQIVSAVFSNASGLEKAGDNVYTATLNSGDPAYAEITANGGSYASGELEMSNVDLSNEFTSMITTQRGFQANSRIITVSDSMLEELINLKR